VIIPFFKYNGTGNDFIMIDNRDLHFDASDKDLIETMCTRHFGIGADGLILLEKHPDYDFKMVYFNSDGNESSMCGNGGRCIIQFAYDLKIIQNKTSFIAIDGPHKGLVLENEISLQMQNVNEIQQNEKYSELDTGSPHYVAFMKSIPDQEFVSLAREIRQNPPYSKDGINVNFAQIENDAIIMRTYERGVEDETLACGTGATAVAIAAHKKGLIFNKSIPVQVKGGHLKIDFETTNNHYTNIWLTGSAQFVFEGKIEI
jgi:diaminopimelate epimerase